MLATKPLLRLPSCRHGTEHGGVCVIWASWRVDALGNREDACSTFGEAHARLGVESRRTNIGSGRPKRTDRIAEGAVGAAQRKNVQLKFDAEEETIDLYVDAEKLEHVFNNLLSNAIKFTPEGGKISVKVAGDRHLAEDSEEGLRPRRGDGHLGYLEVRVKDTGVGIPKDKLPFVFDRFYQAHVNLKEQASACRL